MTGQIIKVTRQPSCFGGNFCYVFIKCEDGKTRKTCVAERYHNYKNWKGLRTGDTIEGLNIKRGNLIDADSVIKKVEKITK